MLTLGHHMTKWPEMPAYLDLSLKQSIVRYKYYIFGQELTEPVDDQESQADGPYSCYISA